MKALLWCITLKLQKVIVALHFSLNFMKNHGNSISWLFISALIVSFKKKVWVSRWQRKLCSIWLDLSRRWKIVNYHWSNWAVLNLREAFNNSRLQTKNNKNSWAIAPISRKYISKKLNKYGICLKIFQLPLFQITLQKETFRKNLTNFKWNTIPCWTSILCSHLVDFKQPLKTNKNEFWWNNSLISKLNSTKILSNRK